MNRRFDVVVVGAGSAGSSAAISAARRGARTLLIDRLAFLGGTSTAVLDTFYAFYTPGDVATRVVGGIGWEVVQALKSVGLAFERSNTYGAGTGVTYDPEALKVVWERLAEQAGVQILLHTWATGVQVRDGRIEAVRLWNKGGESVVEAGVVVDASGDADLCAMAGVPYDDARSTPNLQSMSTIFRVANVDVDRAASLPKTELWALMRKAAEGGGYRLPRLEGSWHRTPYTGVVTVHMTRIPNVDATD
ncbi:MAG TPA: FAD-dependent oxidoreductase, partial [Candidatus Dormibacteraeota bacterium]|nr:FAD-dependent oxidoreductase [Candidatus Dormibacteraeota bacterium]